MEGGTRKRKLQNCVMNFLKLYLKERKQKTTNTSEDVGKVKTDFLLVGVKTHIATIKISLETPLKS